MTPGQKARKQRLWLIILSLICMSTGTAIILTAFGDNLIFFYDPTQIHQGNVTEGKTIRIGGMVKAKSLKQEPSSMHVEFVITDLEHTVPVHYEGVLPPMFREGQGVVAEGVLNEQGTFNANRLLTKHDENYMPPEVADALKKSGLWQGGDDYE